MGKGCIILYIPFLFSLTVLKMKKWSIKYERNFICKRYYSVLEQNLLAYYLFFYFLFKTLNLGLSQSVQRNQINFEHIVKRGILRFHFK